MKTEIDKIVIFMAADNPDDIRMLKYALLDAGIKHKLALFKE